LDLHDGTCFLRALRISSATSQPLDKWDGQNSMVSTIRRKKVEAWKTPWIGQTMQMKALWQHQENSFFSPLAFGMWFFNFYCDMKRRLKVPSMWQRIQKISLNLYSCFWQIFHIANSSRSFNTGPCHLSFLDIFSLTF